MTFTIAIMLISLVHPRFFQDGEIIQTNDGVRFRVETVLSNLEIPWSMVFDREGNLYFTERPGRIQVLRKGEKGPTLIDKISEVHHQGEGGLMGLALHPDFEKNRYLYVSYTFEFKEGLSNRVVRYRVGSKGLENRTLIVPFLPGAFVHNGCRIRFGPDGKLYVTTGDAAQRAIAQNPASLGGKILRVNDDGSIPNDNPDPKSPVFALGVRNPQGIDWHPESGLLFETEHGPSGFDGPGGGDEINIIQSGQNYGWPVVHHRDSKEGMQSPIAEYTPALAPASGVFYAGAAFPEFRNNFFFGCLRGQRIQRLVLEPADPSKIQSQESLLLNRFKRIREITVGPDGFIYFSTSNRDRRAEPAPEDDRIMRLVPAS